MSGFLVVTAAATLAVVFVFSLAAKVRGATAFAGFEEWLHSLAVLPDRFIRAVAVAMIGAETTALVLVAIPAARAVGLLLGAALIAFFAASIWWLTRRGRSVGCRCFGTARRPMGRVEIIRNCALALL